jgi:hypothetical protein
VTNYENSGCEQQPQVFAVRCDSRKVLIDAIGADQIAALVSALLKEANFERVRAWREV